MHMSINRNLYGVTSLIFILASIIIADIELYLDSIYLGIVYSLIIITSNFLLVYVFCTKCPCKNHCGHIIPGRLALVFTNRKTGPYSKSEISLTAGLLAVLIIFPQIWLWKNQQIFWAFWALVITGTIQIRTVVCRSCDNSFCPVRINTDLNR